mgnify:FL=1
MIAKKPPLGWNTWNTFGENINEALILETADKMIEYGYKDAGYEYVVIDDCWALKKRGIDGRLVPDPEKFPHGMKYIADYLHERGLKFGMYSCAGTLTCAGYPSSYGHEYVDAKTFAEWEVDYLKYDFCNFPLSGNCKNAYLTMSIALRSCGRDILFAACNWGMENPWEWMRSIGAHMYRSTGDILDSFTSFKDILLSQEKNFSMSTPGCYNDIDMLTVGMYGKGNTGIKNGCTDEEYKLQFALWCMFSAPLMMGGDIRNMNDFCKNLMQNKELLAIDQDEEGRPPYALAIWGNENIKMYFKFMSDNQFAVMFVNFEDEKRTVHLSLPDIGLSADCGKQLELHDVFTGEYAGILHESLRFDVEPHSCVLYKGKMINA